MDKEKNEIMINYLKKHSIDPNEIVPTKKGDVWNLSYLIKRCIEATSDSHAFNWEDLRKRFYEECTDKNEVSGVELVTVNLSPHNLFEWFRDYLLHHVSRA